MPPSFQVPDKIHKPTNLDYSTLLELTKKHYNPRQSVIMQQYKFNSRNQRADESIFDLRGTAS